MIAYAAAADQWIGLVLLVAGVALSVAAAVSIHRQENQS